MKNNNNDIEIIEIGERVHKEHSSYKFINDIQYGIKKSIIVNSQESNIIKPTELNEMKIFYSTSKAQVFKNSNEDSIAIGIGSGVNNIDGTGSGSNDSSGSSSNKDNETIFKFKNYQANAFKYLRQLFGISIEEFLESFCSKDKPFIELSSPGKSGSFFYFSYNMKYIIKTISKDESKLLRKILPKYIQHIQDSPLTLIPKFYGMFRVEGKHHHLNKIRFIIIENIFPSNKKISLRFDLKGSHQDRETKNKPINLDTITYKDLDFINDKLKLVIDNQDLKLQFINQIKSDSKFLKSLNIMDYSLLVGIHFNNNNNNNSNNSGIGIGNGNDSNYSGGSGGTSNQIKLNEIKSKILIHPSLLNQQHQEEPSTNEINLIEKDIVYYIGIIDILVLYNYKKKFAHLYKTIKYGSKSDISTIAPQKYYKRFKKFIISLVE